MICFDRTIVLFFILFLRLSAYTVLSIALKKSFRRIFLWCLVCLVTLASLTKTKSSCLVASEESFIVSSRAFSTSHYLWSKPRWKEITSHCCIFNPSFNQPPSSLFSLISNLTFRVFFFYLSDEGPAFLITSSYQECVEYLDEGIFNNDSHSHVWRGRRRVPKCHSMDEYKDLGCQGTALHAATLKGGIGTFISPWRIFCPWRTKEKLSGLIFRWFWGNTQSATSFTNKQKSKGLMSLSGELQFHVCPVGGDIYTWTHLYSKGTYTQNERSLSSD